MGPRYDIGDIGIADRDFELRDRKSALMDELMRRALEQNPDLAHELQVVEMNEAAVRQARRRAQIQAYREVLAKREAEHRAQRKIRYDDKRNINALLGLRRSLLYKAAPRMKKIQMELDEYYSRYNIEPPEDLLKDLAKLKHAKELYLKRVKRDENGKIIREHMAG